MIATVQYSQCSHLVRNIRLRDILAIVPDHARTYVEDCVYGSMANSPWNHNRLAIYAPPGDMQRSYHLDGRGGEDKGEFWW
ncbi:MAG: hypothetical protein U5Q03_14955 [Bacteroidota bacterium]|nr:hypothetical protein [Bacteroidota bacterium]